MPTEHHDTPECPESSRIRFDDSAFETSSLGSTLGVSRHSPQSAEVRADGECIHQRSTSPSHSPLQKSFLATETVISQETANSVQHGRARNSPIQRTIHFGWWWETSSALLSVTCTALIVAILFSIDGKPALDWKLPIQPNSLVAVFSTVAKSALLFPLAECLGQLKWAYFEKPRTVNELETFDAASRGPWGAARLLWEMKGRALLASLGAITTILMLAFEPFAQQVIVFSSRNHQYHNMTGSLSVSQQWLDSPGTESATGPPAGRNAYIPLMTGVLTALADQPYSPQPNFGCPSAECRVADVHALGICSTCESEPIDVNGFDDCKCTILGRGNQSDPVSNGTYKEFSDYFKANPVLNDPYHGYMAWTRCKKSYEGFPTIQLNYDGVNSDATLSQEGGVYGTSQEAIWNNDGSLVEQTTDNIPGARLRFCTYNESLAKEGVTKGENQATTVGKATCFSSETDISLYSNINKIGQINGTVTRCNLYLCAHNYDSVVISNGEKTYNGVGKSRLSTTETGLMYLKNYTNINWTTSAAPNLQFRAGYLSRLDLIEQFLAIANPIDQQYQQISSFQSNKISNSTAFDNFTVLFNRFADTMTSIMQSSVNPNISTITMDAFGPEIYVRVEWKWMLMPLSVVFISLLFMIATVFRSSKKEYLFKTSILAVLFHGLDTQNRSSGVVGETGQDMTGHKGGAISEDNLMGKAKGVRAVLGRDRGGCLKLKTE